MALRGACQSRSVAGDCFFNAVCWVTSSCGRPTPMVA